jgi:iron complex outermembrane receptor protein
MTTLAYTLGDLNLSLRWQYYANLDQAAIATGSTYSTTGAPPYSLFDLLLNYNLTERLRLRGGIENLLNTEPPLIGVDNSVTTGMTGGMFSPGAYDTNGRRFYLGLRLEL